MSDFINTIDVMGDEELEKAIIEGTITEFNDNIIQQIGKFGLSWSKKLKSVDFPNLTETGDCCFYQCQALTDVNLPMLETVGTDTFQYCTSLKRIVLPKANRPTFRYCGKLEWCDMPSAIRVENWSFTYCTSLRTVILRSTTLVPFSGGSGSLQNCYHFTGTVNATYNPTGAKDGYFYVPRALVEQYKVATNWSVYATQFRAIEDYTVDGTIYGELDESKI